MRQMCPAGGTRAGRPGPSRWLLLPPGALQWRGRAGGARSRAALLRAAGGGLALGVSLAQPPLNRGAPSWHGARRPRPEPGNPQQALAGAPVSCTAGFFRSGRLTWWKIVREVRRRTQPQEVDLSVERFLRGFYKRGGPGNWEAEA